MQAELFARKQVLKCAPPNLPIGSDWTPPADYPNWWNAPRVSIDLETQDVELKTRGSAWGRGGEGKIVGAGVAIDGARPIYVPFDHGTGSNVYGNLDKRISLGWLKKIAEAPNDKVIFNAGYDTGWLSEYGITLQGRLLDPAIATPLIDENRLPGKYNLDSICDDWLGEKKDERLMKAAARSAGIGCEGDALKRDMWQLHSKYVGPYAEQDAALNLRLWDYCKELLDKENLWKAYDLEVALVPILTTMRRRGVRVDLDAGERVLTVMQEEHGRISDRFKQEHGINLPSENSNLEIAAVADSLELKYGLTEKGGPSFTKDFLKVQTHPLFRGIQDLRNCSNVQSLVRSQLEYANKGRIHCTLNPLKGDEGGTVTYRFSSRHPNLQQVPSRGHWGRLVRSIFLPEEGAQWLKADYSEQEYRLLVHYAQLKKCKGAAKAVRLYEEGGSFHDGTVRWMGWNLKDDRWKAKILNFGMAYAMTEKGVSAQLGCSEGEALEVLTEYHSRVPFVGEIDTIVRRSAMRRGWIRLMYGHLCHFNRWEPSRYEARDKTSLPLEEALIKWPKERLVRAFGRKALNKLIQGSGAGMIKKAMVELGSGGLYATLQVHDELDSSVESTSQVEMIQEAMTDVARDMLVPIKVDADVGPNWAGKPFDELLEAA